MADGQHLNADEVALVLEGFKIDGPLQEAIRICDAREKARLSDLKPEQHLEYPSSPSLDSSYQHSPMSSSLPIPSVSSETLSTLRSVYKSQDILILDLTKGQTSTLFSEFLQMCTRQQMGK